MALRARRRNSCRHATCFANLRSETPLLSKPAALIVLIAMRWITLQPQKIVDTNQDRKKHQLRTLWKLCIHVTKTHVLEAETCQFPVSPYEVVAYTLWHTEHVSAMHQAIISQGVPLDDERVLRRPCELTGLQKDMRPRWVRSFIFWDMPDTKSESGRTLRKASATWVQHLTRMRRISHDWGFPGSAKVPGHFVRKHKWASDPNHFPHSGRNLPPGKHFGYDTRRPSPKLVAVKKQGPEMWNQNKHIGECSDWENKQNSQSASSWLPHLILSKSAVLPQVPLEAAETPWNWIRTLATWANVRGVFAWRAHRFEKFAMHLRHPVPVTNNKTFLGGGFICQDLLNPYLDGRLAGSCWI